MKKLQILGIIPARFSSTRFPGKPLAKIKGISMIERVYRQCLRSEQLTHLFVATDDLRIFDHVRDFGGKAIMTEEHHASGTDRCFEALTIITEQIPDFSPNAVINIQGDEPMIDPSVINSLALEFKNSDVEIVTASTSFMSLKDVYNSNTVKIVTDNQNNAMYFSRSPVPFFRDEHPVPEQFRKHIGIYAYRTDILKSISALSQSLLEKIESLEQLRWLESGFRIRVQSVASEGMCVDVPEDISLVENFMNKHNIP